MQATLINEYSLFYLAMPRALQELVRSRRKKNLLDLARQIQLTPDFDHKALRETRHGNFNTYALFGILAEVGQPYLSLETLIADQLSRA